MWCVTVVTMAPVDGGKCQLFCVSSDSGAGTGGVVGCHTALHHQVEVEGGITMRNLVPVAATAVEVSISHSASDC